MSGSVRADSSDSDEDVPVPRKGRRKMPVFTAENDCISPPKNKVYTSRFLQYRKMRSKMTEAPTFLNGKGGADVNEEEETNIFEKNGNNQQKVLMDDDPTTSDDIQILSSINAPQVLLEDDVLPKITQISQQATSILKSFDEVANVLRVSKGIATNDQLNSSTISLEDCECLDSIPSVRDITVKIRWRANIIRFSMKSNERFATILPEVAKRIGVEVTNMVLSLDEMTIKSTDTPESINLTIIDILDCYVIKRSTTEGSDVDENVIELKLQSENRWKKVAKIHMDSPMQRLIEECASEKGIPPSKVVFQFDGEDISPSETPTDLDLESGLCIDVKFLP